MIVEDGDDRGAYSGVYKAVGAAGEGAMIYPDVAGAGDGHAVAIGAGPPGEA